MNKLLISFVFLWVFQNSVFGGSFKSIYKIGKGSTYFMKSKGGADANVSIYITSVGDRELSVEYFIESVNTFLPSKLWQQFKLYRPSDGAIKITHGYILKDGNLFPEKMEEKHLKGKDGVKTTDFLFSTFKQINKYLINKEQVVVPAGTISANRYKLESNGQTVEFWIAKDQSPLTLVKLVSSGKIPAHNYQLQLITLITNVAAKIDPSKARPLSESMRKVLETSLK